MESSGQGEIILTDITAKRHANVVKQKKSKNIYSAQFCNVNSAAQCKGTRSA